MIRKEIIKTKLQKIEESVDIAKKHPKKLEDFLELGLIKDGIYKKIEFAIENIIDICNIINSDFKARDPERRGRSNREFGEKGVISKELAKKVKSMRGFRNFF